MDIVPNNVFLTQEELEVTLAALRNALRIEGLSENAVDTLLGAQMEIAYAIRENARRVI